MSRNEICKNYAFFVKKLFCVQNKDCAGRRQKELWKSVVAISDKSCKWRLLWTWGVADRWEPWRFHILYGNISLPIVLKYLMKFKSLRLYPNQGNLCFAPGQKVIDLCGEAHLAGKHVFIEWISKRLSLRRVEIFEWVGIRKAKWIEERERATQATIMGTPWTGKWVVK